VLPSLYVPIAMNCCVVPNAIEGVVGVTAIERRVGALVTVSTVDPVTLTDVALTVAVPKPTPVACPCVPGWLLTVATVVVSEFHCTVSVMFCVVPSV